MYSTQVYVRREGEAWRCHLTPDGLKPEDLGCEHVKPREAIRHAKAVEPQYAPPQEDTDV